MSRRLEIHAESNRLPEARGITNRPWANAALNMMGRERTLTYAFDRLLNAFGWLEAAGEIEVFDLAILVGGKLRVRFRDSMGASQEFVLAGVPPKVLDAVREQKAENEDFARRVQAGV
jgi:hypothetical protein